MPTLSAEGRFPFGAPSFKLPCAPANSQPPTASAKSQYNNVGIIPKTWFFPHPLAAVIIVQTATRGKWPWLHLGKGDIKYFAYEIRGVRLQNKTLFVKLELPGGKIMEDHLTIPSELWRFRYLIKLLVQASINSCTKNQGGVLPSHWEEKILLKEENSE